VCVAERHQHAPPILRAAINLSRGIPTFDPNASTAAAAAGRAPRALAFEDALVGHLTIIAILQYREKCMGGVWDGRVEVSE